MRLRQYFRELSRRIRKWLNKSRLVLGLTLLVIGISYTHLYHELTQKSHTTILFEARNALAAETVKDTTEVVEPLKSQNLSLEDKIRQTFPEEPAVMLAIAKTESGLNPKAVNINTNGTKDVGVFQVNTVHGYSEEWLKNEDNNLFAAREIYEKQGKKAWVVYNQGYYLGNL